METLVAGALAESCGADFASLRFVVGVSGGLDSCVLLDVVSRLIPSAHLCVAHFNHKTRGSESDGDADFVARLAASFRLKFIKGERAGEGTSENSLRAERLSFLENCLACEKAQFILTAHHLDDQLETFLMRALRGSGVDGLSGIAPRRGLFVRPLLTLSRAFLESYAKERRVVHREDASNSGPQYLRNRIRHTVVPALDKLAGEFGGSEEFRQRLSGTMNELRWAGAELSATTGSETSRIATRTPFWTRVDKTKYFDLKTPWRLRVLRRILADLGSDPSSRERLAEADGALRIISGKLCLPLGVTVMVSCGYLFFQNATGRAALNEPLHLEIHPDTVRCAALGLAIDVAPQLQAGAEWRFPLPGDRMGTKKLKRALLDARIPLPERRLLPVLARTRSSDLVWCLPFAEEGIRLTNLTFPFSFLVR